MPGESLLIQGQRLFAEERLTALAAFRSVPETGAWHPVDAVTMGADNVE
jgi:hypothetical protein